MLKRVVIKGYKSIREMDLALRPINVLIGANGVGKTNFISFFKLINYIYEQRLQNYTMQNRADNLFYYGIKATKELSGYLDFGDNAYEVVLQPRDNGSLFVAEESCLHKGYPLYSYINIEESRLRDSDDVQGKELGNHLQGYKIYHFHDTGKGAPLRSSADVEDNRALREDGSNLPAYLYMLQQVFPKTLKRIELVVKSVMPYFERFDLAPRILDGKIDLVWNDNEVPDKYFSANHLSDGSMRFIALATLLLQPVLPKVIIIDEPELGLHPVAIAKLAGMIQSAATRGCQVILSTQSVNFISYFQAEDIITVDRQGGQSVFNRLERQELDAWLQDYTLGELWTKNVINGQPVVL